MSSNLRYQATRFTELRLLQVTAKMAVFEIVMAKITKCLTMVISILIGVSNCLEGSIFFAIKCGFTEEVFTLKQQFLLQT